MGSPLDSWDGYVGAYYNGAGGTWEPIWAVACLGLCALALVVGLVHEKVAYRRMKRKYRE